jgi:hypothetical protein
MNPARQSRNRNRRTSPKDNVFRKFENEYPGWTLENSRAFQRWFASQTGTSPGGTAESISQAVDFSRPFRDANALVLIPGVQTPGYCQLVPPGLTHMEFPNGTGVKESC